MSWINGFLFWSILPLLVSGLLGQLDLALWGMDLDPLRVVDQQELDLARIFTIKLE